MKISRLKSKHPMTPYAPSWNAPISFSQWEETDKIDTIRKFLLTKIDILGDPGYSKKRYNVFDWSEECKELDDLLNWIREQYLQFTQIENTQIFPLRFNCWFNVLEHGQSLPKHNHGRTETSYLSANMHLDDYDESTTMYEHMGMKVNRPNFKGGLSIFPTWLEHYVPEYKGTKQRVSIAMDLYVYQPPIFDIVSELEHRSFNV